MNPTCRMWDWVSHSLRSRDGSGDRWSHRLERMGIKIEPLGYGPQVFVLGSIYQGSPFWVPIFDPLPDDLRLKLGFGFGIPTNLGHGSFSK